MKKDRSSLPRSRYERFVKPVFDVVIAMILLVVLFPLAVLVAAVVWFRLGRPVLFKQIRPGRDGRPFTLVKFRSMLPEDAASEDGITDAARLTGFGRKLRRSSLDELPELWNIAKGEMSFVGPRPLLMRYNDRYSTTQARRLLVKPGLTGWAQINGRNATTWDERLSNDVWYVDNVSFLLDLKIILQTIPVIILGNGVSPEEAEIMPEFLGDQSETSSTHRVEP